MCYCSSYYSNVIILASSHLIAIPVKITTIPSAYIQNSMDYDTVFNFFCYSKSQRVICIKLNKRFIIQ